MVLGSVMISTIMLSCCKKVKMPGISVVLV